MINWKKALPSFYYITESDADLFHINLYGRLDANQMSNLDMPSIIKDIGSRDCILNLGKLDFLDSTGLVFFLKIHKHLATYDKFPILCDPPENVMQMFRITKLVNLFHIEPDVNSAKMKLEKTR